MAEQLKSSAGALRAANILENEYPSNCEHVDYEGYCSPCFVQWEAEVIDRETGVAELLEAAKRLVEIEISQKIKAVCDNETAIDYLGRFYKLQEAIAQVERGA